MHISLQKEEQVLEVLMMLTKEIKTVINGEIELDLKWTRNCVISEISRTAAVTENLNANPPDQPVAPTQTTGATFQINNAKLYVPVVTLSINNNIKFLENIKQGPKRTIS